jgi:ribosomal protein L28
MALRCDFCEKGKTIGKSGAHKYGGKWAMRAIKTTKIWRPNLQNYTLDGVKVRICTKCLKRVKFEQRKEEEAKKAVKVKPDVPKVEKKVVKPPVKKISKRPSKAKSTK